MRFNPHTAKPEYRRTEGTPELYFTPLAIQKMQVYVDKCQDEVGWLGSVAKYAGEKYLCTDVHLLHQEVNGGTTEITPEGLVLFAEEIGFEEMADVHLWGHSHVNMGVSASGQDESQMSLFEDNGIQWFFRIICNKRGSISVSYYNYKESYIVDDCPWQEYVEPVIVADVIEREIAEKVKKKVYVYPGNSQSRFTGGWGNQARNAIVEAAIVNPHTPAPEAEGGKKKDESERVEPEAEEHSEYWGDQDWDEVAWFGTLEGWRAEQEARDAEELAKLEMDDAIASLEDEVLSEIFLDIPAFVVYQMCGNEYPTDALPKIYGILHRYGMSMDELVTLVFRNAELFEEIKWGEANGL